MTAILEDSELEDIIKRLNRTLTGIWMLICSNEWNRSIILLVLGTINYDPFSQNSGNFDIDLSNPIHVNMDMTSVSEETPYYFTSQNDEPYIYA